MRAVAHPSPRAFLERAASFLEATDLENNVIASIVHRATLEPDRYPDGVWSVTLEEGDRVTGVALQTPPMWLLVTALPSGGPECLAEALAGRQTPGIVGPRETADTLARLIDARVDPLGTQYLRLYDLRSPPLPPTVPGRFRLIGSADRKLAIEWREAFAQEIGDIRPAQGFARQVDADIASRSSFLWDLDGVPVSMVVAIAIPPRGCRIGGVYTPPERRRALLEEGRAWCCLYTDLANPTSNFIYTRIGYRPVRDVVRLNFARDVGNCPELDPLIRSRKIGPAK